MSETTDETPDSGIRVLTKGLTPEEIAAVTVVVEAAVAAELESLHDEPAFGPSAWERSQRGLRVELHPGRHEWRGFGGATL